MNDMPSCSNTVERKARKDHVCNGCSAQIKKGDNYIYISGIWNGEPESFKECINCYAVISNFKLMDESLLYDEGPSLEKGGVRCWLQDFIYSGWKGEQAARDISELFSVPIEYSRKQLGMA